MRVSLIVPAAGSGQRLGQSAPKALADVGGAALLRRTLDALADAGPFVETVVLSPAGWERRFEAATGPAPPGLGRLRVLAGAATRQASVATGLAALEAASDLVCVHDAARPLVAAPTLRRVLEVASESGAATAAARPVDSVREDADGGGSRAVERSRLWLVETPQAFRRSLLEKAHGRAGRDAAVYTDDAALVEAIGTSVQVVESENRNLKVTFPEDLELLSLLLGLPAPGPAARR